jgi:predicted short-subunit dehydrogenase-like oxidoreductase (DUF2520 family)
MKLYIIGAGNVGLGIALALQQRGHVISGILVRKPNSRVFELTGVTPDIGRLGSGLTQASVVLVCVSDHAISSVGTMLQKSRLLKAQTTVAHMSGCYASTVLGDIPSVYTASMHPLAPCPTPERAAVVLQGAFYALEGASEGVAVLKDIVRSLGGEYALIAAENKVHYHAIAALACNLVVALVHLASEQAQSIAWQHAEKTLLNFAKAGIEQAQILGISEGLTGPAFRGDTATVAQHIQSLSGEALIIYKLLSKEVLRIAKAKGVADLRALETLLN